MTTSFQLIQTGPKTGKATYVPTDPDKAEAHLPKLPSSGTRKQVLYTTGLAQETMGKEMLPVGGHKTVAEQVLNMLSQLFGDIVRQPASAEPRVSSSPVAKPADKASPNETRHAAAPANTFARNTNVAVLQFILFSGNQVLLFTCCFTMPAQQPSAGAGHRPLGLAGPTGGQSQHTGFVPKQLAQAKATAPASSMPIEEPIGKSPSVAKPVGQSVFEDLPDDESANDETATHAADSLKVKELAHKTTPVAPRPIVQPPVEYISDEATSPEETHVEPHAVEQRAAEERLVEEHQEQKLRQDDARSIEEHHQRIDKQRAERGPIATPPAESQPADIATLMQYVKLSESDRIVQEYMKSLSLVNAHEQSQNNAREHQALAERHHYEAQRHFDESKRATLEADRKQFQAQQWRHPAASDADLDKAAQLEQEAQRYRDLALQHTQSSLDRVALSQEHLEQAKLADQQAEYAQQLLQRPEVAATSA